MKNTVTKKKPQQPHMLHTAGLLALLLSFGQTHADNTAVRAGSPESIFKIGLAAIAAKNAKTYDANTLTVGQLRQCVLMEKNIYASEDILQNRKPDIVAAQKKLDGMSADMAQLQQYLKSRQQTPAASEKEVQEFNEKVDKHNALVSRYNKTLDGYRRLEKQYDSDINTYNALVKRFNSGCEGKNYYKDDLLAVQQKTGR